MEKGGLTIFHTVNTERMAKRYMFDVTNRNGKHKVWSVYADSIEEAAETAKTMCRMFGAEYIGNLTGGMECKL